MRGDTGSKRKWWGYSCLNKVIRKVIWCYCAQTEIFFFESRYGFFWDS